MYDFRHLLSHLEEAGEHGRIARLLALEWQPPAPDRPTGGAPLQRLAARIRRGAIHPEAMRRNAWFDAKEAIGDRAGYLVDIERTWRTSELVTTEAIGRGEGSPSIELVVRYAAIAASIRSLAELVPPELVRALLATGVWSPAQAIASANQVPAKDRELSSRDRGLKGLVSLLVERDDPDNAQVAARAIGNDAMRAGALALIVPVLAEGPANELMREALHLACLAPDSHRRSALAEVAPVLGLSEVAYAVEQARAVASDSFPGTETFAALAVRLADLGDPAGALEIVRTLPGNVMPQALRSLVPHLPVALLVDVLDMANAVDATFMKRELLDALLPFLTEPLRRRGLEIAESITHELARDVTVAAYAARLGEWALLHRALSRVRKAADAGERLRCLRSVAPCVGEAERLLLLREALEVARKIRFSEERAEALTRLLGDLPEPLRSRAAREALSRVAKIAEPFRRSHAFEQIADNVNGPIRMRALQEALKAASGMLDRMAEIAGRLGRAEVERVFALAQTLGDAKALSDASTALVSCLPTVEDQLEAAERLADRELRTRALVAAAARASDEGQPGLALDVVERLHGADRAAAVEAVAPSLACGSIDRALRAAKAIHFSAYFRSIALAAVAQRIGACGNLDRALAIVDRLNTEAANINRSQAIVALAGHAAAQGRLDDARRLSALINDPSDRVESMCATARHLAGEERVRLLAEARAMAEAIDPPRNGYALHFLVETLLEEGSWQGALAIARSITGEGWGGQMIAEVAGIAPEPDRGSLYAEARETVLHIDEPSYAVLALTDLMQRLPPRLREETLDEVVRRAEGISGIGGTMSGFEFILGPLALELRRQSPGTAHAICTEVLHSSAELGRPRFLAVLTGLAPLLIALGTPEGARGFRRVLEDIGRWWP